jgi:hypothetical protein
MRIGLVYTIHTVGRDLGYEPHVYLVITKGGLMDGKWVEIECVPGAVTLCEVCRSNCTLSGGKSKMPLLTVLVFAASSAQWDDSGRRRLSEKGYFCMPLAMGISNCRHG